MHCQLATWSLPSLSFIDFTGLAVQSNGWWLSILWKFLNVWMSQSKSLLLKEGILFPLTSPCFSCPVTSVEISVKTAVFRGDTVQLSLLRYSQNSGTV